MQDETRARLRNLWNEVSEQIDLEILLAGVPDPGYLVSSAPNHQPVQVPAPRLIFDEQGRWWPAEPIRSQRATIQGQAPITCRYTDYPGPAGGTICVTDYLRCGIPSTVTVLDRHGNSIPSGTDPEVDAARALYRCCAAAAEQPTNPTTRSEWRASPHTSAPMFDQHRR